MTNAEIEKLFIPLTYQGSAQVFIDRLALSSTLRGPRRSEPRVEFRAESKPQSQQDVTKPRLPVAPQLPQVSVTDIPSAETPPAPPETAPTGAPPAEAPPTTDLQQVEIPSEPPARPDDDSPGAFMAVLSRTEAEAHSAGDTDGERKPS